MYVMLWQSIELWRYGKAWNRFDMQWHGNDMTSKGIGKLSFTEQWH